MPLSSGLHRIRTWPKNRDKNGPAMCPFPNRAKLASIEFPGETEPGALYTVPSLVTDLGDFAICTGPSQSRRPSLLLIQYAGNTQPVIAPSSVSWFRR